MMFRLRLFAATAISEPSATPRTTLVSSRPRMLPQRAGLQPVKVWPAMALAAFSVTALMLLGSSAAAAQTTPEGEFKSELRGVWLTNVDSDVLNTRSKIAEAMDFLADNGFNVVFPVVWNKGYTLHPSKVAQEAIGELQDPYFAQQRRDPLAEVIIEAHRRGMEVIPWFEYGFASVYGDRTGGHILQRNPEWASRNASGAIANANGFYWMNAFHHEVQQFMLDMITEVIENYDVDGVQGDDRLPAITSSAGYSDYTKALYASEHDGAEVPSNFRDAGFIQWRADKLTNFAGRLYRTVKEHDPELMVSFSPSVYRWSLDNYLQDWPNWIDSSYVDIVHPQLYRYNLEDYKSLVRSMFGASPAAPYGYLYASAKPMVFPGMLIKAGSAFNRQDYILPATTYNREFGMNGEVFFFYEGLDEKNNFLADSLHKYRYPQKAIPPYRGESLRRFEAPVVDEDDPGVTRTGEWTSEGTPAGYVDRSLVAVGGSDARLSYSVDVPTEAWYRVFTYVPGGPRVTSNAHYRILAADGDTTVVLNHQLAANRGWVELATVRLEPGEHPVMEVMADSTDDGRNVHADALMLLIERRLSPDAAFPITVSTRPEPAGAEIPDGLALLENHPNPFNPTTMVRFRLDRAAVLTLQVYDVAGRRVGTLIDSKAYPAGEHAQEFRAEGLSSGTYLLRLSDGSRTAVRQVLLLK